MSSLQPEPQRALHKVRQACKCCRVRKIRCDGLDPCKNCQRTKLLCTYAEPKKKGPKRQGACEDAFHTAREQQVIQKVHIHQIPNPSVSHFRPSPLLSFEIIHDCLDAFFTYKYPIMPILDREEIIASMYHLHESPVKYSLITALCAAITVQTEIPLPSLRDGALKETPEIDSMSPVDFLISETYRARKFFNHIDSPSLASVQASFFLFAVFFCLGRDNAAWFYIRESITMLQLLDLHEEATYTTMADTQYATCCRRTFWLLFITERAYALQRHQPLTLKSAICLPNVEPGPEATIISGFLDLVALFQNFDDAFMSLWNQSSNSIASPQYLVELQDFLKCAIPLSERTKIQQADLEITRLWLKTIVWQLSVSKGLLSSKSATESMSFHYPVTITRDIVHASRSLPVEAFQANGVGILEKIFDIGCSLVDVLLVHPKLMRISALEIGPRDYLMELVRILGTDVKGSSNYQRLLATMVDDYLEMRLRGSFSASNILPGVRQIDWDENMENHDVVYGPPISTASG